MKYKLVKMAIFLVVMCLLLLLPMFSEAASILNGSFEWGVWDAGWMTESEGTYPAANWTHTGIIFIPWPLFPPDGNRVAVSDFAFVPWGVNQRTVIYRDVYLEPNYSHTLSVSLLQGSIATWGMLRSLEFNNTHFRVDVIRSGADIWTTDPADIYATVYETNFWTLPQPYYWTYSVDLSDYAGQTVRLRAAVIYNFQSGFLGETAVAVDNFNIVSTPNPSTTLDATASCNGNNLDITINDGDGPFNISTSNGTGSATGVATGTTQLTGPNVFENVTVTESVWNNESRNLGSFICGLSPTVTIHPSTAAEGSTGSFVVSVNPVLPVDVIVFFATADGTATQGTDYTVNTSSPVTIPANTSSATIGFSALSDNEAENDETFTATITRAGGNYGSLNIAGSPATATIIDMTPRSIYVNPTGPISLSEAGPESQTFTFTLSSEPTNTVTIPISLSSSECTITAGGSAISLDSTTWNTGYAVTVEAVNDTVVDGALACNLITGDPTSADTGYDNLQDTDSPDVSITITDDDAAAVTIEDVTLAEDGPFEFTATLDNTTAGSFTVDWTFAHGTTVDADFVGGTTPTGTTLSFAGAAGETQTFSVPVLDDGLVEPNETFTVGLTNFVPSGAFVVGITDTALGTILDNEGPVIADDDTYTTREDEPLNVDATHGVLNGDSGGNGSPLQAVLIATTPRGTLTLNADGSFDYVFGTGLLGADSFTYYATDGTNVSAPATVTINILRANGKLSANDDNTDMPWNTSTTLNVLANDVDPEGDPLHIAVMSQPAHGQAVMEHGMIVYTPNPGYFGVDEFSYTAADDFGAADDARVGIIVWQPVPLCADFDGSTNEIIRADVPGGTITNGSVFCRVLTENTAYVRNSAEVGRPEVINRGVIQAVDVFALYHDGSSTVYFNHPIGVCLQGSGAFLYLDATLSPRAVVELPVYMQNGYTCASVPNAGTVVLVGGSASVVNPAPDVSVPTGSTTALSGCMVTTRDILNLREQPHSTGAIMRMIPYDVTLTAFERTAGWFYVDYNGERGWVSAAYVTPQGHCGQ